ncbi:hypothetical protein Dd703_1665 [Musicola paradisiaca Ech703]|uniref:Uncharacterized protein n=1 Tax=Musicola paradisiaca (strain Ech703) TaxID=579405 RepID=C6C488_MUSP7|nr:hypothetical protein Dd703_1665 [Musicola paradisiaca Ech703]
MYEMLLIVARDSLKPFNETTFRIIVIMQRETSA